MDIFETRRENLRRWIAKNGTPAKERSLFSQLKADGSFGERVARRLEDQYRMGAGFLDQVPSEASGAGLEAGGREMKGADFAGSEMTADEMLRLAAEMIDTYRLAGPTDRKRIELVFREVRGNLATVDKAKSRGS